MRFGHAGMLKDDSFVMYDHQTDSLWVHVTGEAFFGPLTGRKLRFIPSTVTTWEQWKARYPHTRVLPGRRREGSVMGTYDGMTRTRNLGLSVLVNWKAKLYPFDALTARPVVNDTHHGEPVLVTYSRGARTATAWRRTLPGRLDRRVLTFAPAEARDRFGNRLLRDRETGSVWSWLTGKSLSGPLKGRSLAPLAYNPILNDRFAVFYPHAPVWAGGPP